MTTRDPLVSVIIPAYNQADFLGEAIGSVLAQTYQNFEIVVVNDASPDHTDTVVRRFDDPRLKYIVHPENRRLSAARNTGILASSGEIIALLDADDYFHPAKLRSHAEFLAEHPEIGATYNPRFELNHSASTVREVHRPPLSVGLADFLLGFPFSPSDMVMRRQWALRLFDERVGTAEDTDLPCRLALDECHFASVDRVLNYRRRHANRPRKNLAGRLEDVVKVLNAVLADPRCPQEVLRLRESALMGHQLDVGFQAFAQGEAELGERLIRESIHLVPALVDGNPSRLAKMMLGASIRDESEGHEAMLRLAFAHLPQEAASIQPQLGWAVGHGYLLRGARKVVWGDRQSGESLLNRAADLGAALDEATLHWLTQHLLNFQTVLGETATQSVLGYLTNCLLPFSGQSTIRGLRACYFVNQAFEAYRKGLYPLVPKSVLSALASNHAYLTNRGVISIFFRSLAYSRSQRHPQLQHESTRLS